MTPRDIQWRKRARSVACLSKRIETEIERSRFRTARGAYMGGALAYARRLFTAIDRLCPENELEASVLLRTLMEIWVNTQWICHGRMNRKAERFFKFELVEIVS